MTPTLQPPHLGGRAVALLVAGSDAEDDGGLGGVVNVGVGEAGGLHEAGGAGPAVHPHEGQLGWGRALGLAAAGLGALDGQVDRVLDDLARGHRGGLPGEVSTVGTLEVRRQRSR